MKSALQLVKQALAGPQATTPTSRMIKIQEGRVWAYGGAFCLSTPVDCSIECAFRPKVMEEFFSVKRENWSLTMEKSSIFLREGDEEYKIPVLGADQVPTLQAVGRRVEIIEQLEHLDAVAKFSRNNTADWTQGAWFRDGMIFGASYGMCFSVNGLEQFEQDFAIPSDAMLALSKIDSILTSVVKDQQAIQFEFEDGTWLASRLLEGLKCPDLMRVFEGHDNPEVFQMIAFSERATERLQRLKFDDEEDGKRMDMLWDGAGGVMSFITPGNDTGRIENAYTGTDLPFRIKGEALRAVLALEPDTLGLMMEKGEPARLCGYGDGFAVAVALTR